MSELQDNVLDDQNSDYTDLESLLAVANSSEFSVSDGFTQEKQEFEKFNSFFEIVTSNETKNLGNKMLFIAIISIISLSINIFLEVLQSGSIPVTKPIKQLLFSRIALSKIYLDRENSNNQVKALNSIMTEVLGKNRLPMLIVDNFNKLKDRFKFNAKVAAINVCSCPAEKNL